MFFIAWQFKRMRNKNASFFHPVAVENQVYKTSQIIRSTETDLIILFEL